MKAFLLRNQDFHHSIQEHLVIESLVNTNTFYFQMHCADLFITHSFCGFLFSLLPIFDGIIIPVLHSSIFWHYFFYHCLCLELKNSVPKHDNYPLPPRLSPS